MKIIITGVHPYDGEYEIDVGRLKNRDIHTVKRISGYTPMEYMDAGLRGDNDLIIGFAIVALQRSGKHLQVNEEALWDAEIGAILVDVTDEEEGDAGVADPPPNPASKPSDTSTRSGEASRSEPDSPPESPPRITGLQASGS